MYLINSRLAGRDVPATLPNSLIPPSLRNEYGTGSQEVLSGQGPSSNTKDLFDLFDDPPAAAPVPSAAPARQPPPPQPQAFQATSFLAQPPSRRMTAQTTGQGQISPTPTGQQAPDRYTAFGE